MDFAMLTTSRARGTGRPVVRSSSRNSSSTPKGGRPDAPIRSNAGVDVGVVAGTPALVGIDTVSVVAVMVAMVGAIRREADTPAPSVVDGELEVLRSAGV